MSERQRDVASPLELNSLPGSPQSVVDESLDRNGEPPLPHEKEEDEEKRRRRKSRRRRNRTDGMSGRAA